MKSALAVFEAGIKDLRWYIEAIEIEWDLLAAAESWATNPVANDLLVKLQHHIGKGVAKRRFDYNSIVISLYGLLEEYVESLIRAYLVSLNNIVPRYSHLPDAIKKSHVDLSFAMLNRIDQTRFRGTVNAESIVANLHSCLSDDDEYRINADSFCLHTANFRQGTIDNIFGKVGIDNVSQRLRYFPTFADYIASHFPGRDASEIRPEVLFFYLNDLADRRNDVAHGTPTDLLSNEILLEYIAFAEAYCGALYELTHCHSLEHIVEHSAVELGEPIKVINSSIVCIAIQNCQIEIGDTLVAATGNSARPYSGSDIQEIQVNSQPVTMVPAASSVEVGLRVSFKAKKNYTYYLARNPLVEIRVREVDQSKVDVSTESEINETVEGEIESLLNENLKEDGASPL